LDASALIGPRAYGRVDPATCAETTPFTCAVTEDKGVLGVTRPDTGVYCLTVPGVDPATIPLTATVDLTGTSNWPGA